MQSLFRHLIEFVIIFPAIVLHEIAHGYVAYRLGDPTAKRAGRLTLNPLVHVDPVGTVVLPILMLVLSGGSYFFGWAKPVPVNFANLRQPKRDMIWVAAAGPLSNLVMAIGTITVPIGSMCFSGFNVTRPAAYAVWSPNIRAT